MYGVMKSVIRTPMYGVMKSVIRTPMYGVMKSVIRTPMYGVMKSVIRTPMYGVMKSVIRTPMYGVMKSVIRTPMYGVMKSVIRTPLGAVCMAEDSLAIQLEEWESGPEPSPDAGALAPGPTVEEALLFESVRPRSSNPVPVASLSHPHIPSEGAVDPAQRPLVGGGPHCLADPSPPSRGRCGQHSASASRGGGRAEGEEEWQLKEDLMGAFEGALDVGGKRGDLRGIRVLKSDRVMGARAGGGPCFGNCEDDDGAEWITFQVKRVRKSRLDGSEGSGAEDGQQGEPLPGGHSVLEISGPTIPSPGPSALACFSLQPSPAPSTPSACSLPALSLLLQPSPPHPPAPSSPQPAPSSPHTSPPSPHARSLQPSPAPRLLPPAITPCSLQPSACCCLLEGQGDLQIVLQLVESLSTSQDPSIGQALGSSLGQPVPTEAPSFRGEGLGRWRDYASLGWPGPEECHEDAEVDLNHRGSTGWPCRQEHESPAAEPLCTALCTPAFPQLDHLGGVATRAAIHYTGEVQLREVHHTASEESARGHSARGHRARGRWRDYASLGWPGPEECQRTRRVDLTTVASTWLAVSAKNIDITEHIDFATPLQEPAAEPLCNAALPSSMHTLDHLGGVANRAAIHYTGEVQLREVLQNLGKEKFPPQSFEQVGTRIAKVLEKNQTSWVLSSMAALYWRVKGQGKRAIDCLRQALNYAPHHMKDVPLISLANIFQNARLWDDALTVARMAVEIAPHFVVNHFTLANVYIAMEEFEKAMRWYESTLKLQPEFAPAKDRLRTIQCYLLTKRERRQP
ncbi:unnamed protein product [Boreogadus saida]